MKRQELSTKEVVWYDEARISEPLETLFNPDHWQQQNCVIGSAHGRGTTWFIQLLSCQGALRHYRRGGLLAKLLKDQYLFSGWESTRAAQELQLLDHLHNYNVNVPRPLAARAVRSGLWYRADIISEKIANATDLVDILLKRPLLQEEYRRIGAQIAQMHEAGVNHTDLNIHNILLDTQGQVWIIDFDKCHRDHGSEFKKRNLDRLLRSFIKERDKREIQWQGSDFQALLTGYNQHNKYRNDIDSKTS